MVLEDKFDTLYQRGGAAPSVQVVGALDSERTAYLASKRAEVQKLIKSGIISTSIYKLEVEYIFIEI